LVQRALFVSLFSLWLDTTTSQRDLAVWQKAKDRISMVVTICLIIVVCILTSTGFGAAIRAEQTPYRVPRVNSDVRVDGVLDEGLWRQALAMELKYEVDPGENIPALVRTELLLCYDENNLYAGITCYDPDPSLVRARICDRDNIGGDDWVGINLDTFNDEQRSFLFLCNPFGIQSDDIESAEGGGTWDAIWISNGRVTDRGYVVEMAIPFSSLRFQRTAGDQIWGIDAIRSYPRDVDHRLGLIRRDRSNNCYWCQFDKLIGFAGATPGENIEIDPTVSGTYAQERGGDGRFEESSSELNPGVTARWGFTPNLTLNVTANPDFSQVEADAAELDINTQFAIYYPEKRPFFLEGSDFFSTRFDAVHTRTIADPNWGIKLTGKEGAHTIGFFSAQDDITNMLFPSSEGSDDTSLDRENLSTAVRYRRDIGRASTFGVLVTDRECDGYFNRLGGVDGSLRISKRDRIRFQALGSTTDYPDSISDAYGQPYDAFKGYATDIYYFHETRSLDWYMVHQRAHPDFRADLGFMTMVDYRYTEAGWGYTWQHDPGHWWHMLNVGSGYEYEDDFDGDLLHKCGIFWFNYAGPIQSYFNMNGAYGKERYDGVEFDAWGVWVDVSMTPSGDFSFYIGSEYGTRIDYDHTRRGMQFEVYPEIEYRLGKHLVLDIEHAYEHLDVDDGRLYTANVSQLKAVYQFNKRMFFRVITQYVHYDRQVDLYEDEDTNSVEQSVFNQLLFSYKLNPQTVFYLGYSDNFEGDQDVDVRQTDRAVFAKIGYAWVF
jgi:hypothetical protein